MHNLQQTEGLDTAEGSHYILLPGSVDQNV